VRERGSAAILVGVATLVVVFLGVAVVGVVQLVATRARAIAAADAAALAAAPVTFAPFGASGSPAQEAGRFAALNGAALLLCDCPVDHSFEVRSVTVRVGVRVRALIFGWATVTASSRAEFDPVGAMTSLSG
jgi:hypothetical protein